MRVLDADMRPSHSTRAETGIAQSVRLMHRDRWLEARGKELLPTRYVHVVFTLPRQLAPLALQNKREIYGLLFRASAETLMEVARDPKRLGAEIGFFSVLHTWNQKLQAHPHVHCVVPAGGLAPHHLRWIDSQQKFFLPVDVLQKCSGASSRTASGGCMASTSSASTEPSRCFRNPKPSQPGFVRCSAPPGWFMPNVHSAVRHTRYGISASTPMGWPFPTIDSSPWQMAGSLFAGAIPLTTTRSV